MGRACGLQKLFQARTALHRECKLIMEGKNKVMGVQEENVNQILAGNTAVITGAGSGIGKSIVKCLLKFENK